MSESSFDAVKNYYVFKYVVDSVSGEPTEHEGEIVAFVAGTNPWEAVENAGYTDANAYGANRMDDENIGVFSKAIAEERKHLTKISKQLKVMTDEQEAERKKYMEERKCPNCNIQMNEQFQCDKCGFGHEGEELVKELDKTIKKEKKKGNDTSELEAVRDTIKESIKK